jgi:hypothetical protein
MAGQQWGIYNPSRYNEEVMDDDDEEEEGEMGLPGLTSSQESATSTTSGGFGPRTPMGNKRRFFEDEDEVGDERGGEEMRLGERVLAVPRRKKWAGMAGKGQGQENVNDNSAVGVVGQDIDFGEADFLDYGLVMDGEVEMGGV